MIFKEGDRVILLPNEEEILVEETGTVLEIEERFPEMMIIEIDKEFLVDDCDDGIREVWMKEGVKLL